MRKTEIFNIRVDHTQQEWDKRISMFIDDIEAKGGVIVAAEPIDKLIIRPVGRKFTVEYPDE